MEIIRYWERCKYPQKHRAGSSENFAFYEGFTENVTFYEGFTMVVYEKIYFKAYTNDQYISHKNNII